MERAPAGTGDGGAGDPFLPVLLRYGETALKSGATRRRFELSLVSCAKALLALAGIRNRAAKRGGRLFVETPDLEKACAVLSRVFGLVSVSRVTRVEFSDLSDLSARCAALVGSPAPGSFAVRAKRSAPYPFDSMDAGREIGAAISERFPSARVDLGDPDLEVFVEIRGGGEALVSTEVIAGPGGIPWGSEGKAVFIFDGTREAVLASWLMMRRGASPTFLYAGATDAQSLAFAAHEFSRIRGYVPRKRIRFFVSQGDDPFAEAADLAKVDGCHAIVSSERAAPPVFSRILSRGGSFGLPVFRPLTFSTEKDLSDLSARVLLPEIPSFSIAPSGRKLGRWEILEARGDG